MTNKITIHKYLGALYEENSYLCLDEATRQVILIDPSTKQLDEIIKQQKLQPVAILLTHAHIDHIYCVDYYVDTYQIPLYLHENEVKKLANPELNLSVWDQPLIVQATPTILKGANSIIKIANFEIEYYLAPGHSEGNLLYNFVGTNQYIVGDSVFIDSIGRYDLPGSNAQAHHIALSKFQDLPENSKLYPGHGKIFYVRDLANNVVYQHFIQYGM